MKKKVKKITKKSYSADHTGVLLEEMNSKIDLILEGYSDLKDRMNKIDIRLSKIEDSVVMDSIKISNIKFNLEELKRDIKDGLNKGTKEHVTNDVDIDNMQKIEKRLNKLEKLVFSKLETAGV